VRLSQNGRPMYCGQPGKVFPWPILLRKSVAIQVIGAPVSYRSGVKPCHAAGSVASGGGRHALTEIRNSWNATRRLGWWSSDEFAEPSQVLSDRGEGELKLSAAWTAQPEPTKS
jgi:hypothetical protein